MRTAPPDRHEGEKGGKRIRNTQIERLAFVLGNIGVGREAEQTYSTFALDSRRNDGNSYVSKDPSWMKQPTPLTDGWYLEGCTSLVQKQAMLHNFRKLGLSSAFGQAAEDFVANKSIEDYFPTDADEPAIRARIDALEEEHEDDA